MITLFIGNVGSGKTSSAVREMYLNQYRLKTYSNIVTKIKGAVVINSDMIIKKTCVGEKKTKGEMMPIYEYRLNKEYWQENPEPKNVVLDEAHTLLNAREFMSRRTKIILEWISLLRRMISTNENAGELTLISQLTKRMDTVVRDMSTRIKYHICHTTKECKKCGLYWRENNEMPERLSECPRCHSYHLKKSNFIIEVYCFKNIEDYDLWKMSAQKTFYSHYTINDIEQYFPLYNSLAWDNLFT